MAAQRDWLEKDFYARLGVPSTASQEEIKKAYHKLARANHPDAKPGDEAASDRFKEISEAFSVLGSEEKRAEYDELRRLGAAGFGGHGGRGAPGGMNFEGGDLGDLFANLFGGGGAGGAQRGRRPQKGADVRASLHLTFDDALQGVKTKLRIRGEGTCDVCAGSGAKPGTTSHVCGTCHGSGTIAVNQGVFSLSEPCHTCGGRGRIIEQPCEVCQSSGSVIKAREITVAIPAGVKDGAVIRVAGRGQPGTGGGPAGDVLVEVEVEPHRLFGRRGDDITLDVPITFAEAALGAKLKVPTPDGETTTIRIPEATASGRTFRIRGKGAPGRGGRHGDLLATVKIVVPEKLSKDQRRLLAELAHHDDTNTRDADLLRAANGGS